MMMHQAALLGLNVSLTCISKNRKPSALNKVELLHILRPFSIFNVENLVSGYNVLPVFLFSLMSVSASINY